jgi:alkaline phosphatase
MRGLFGPIVGKLAITSQVSRRPMSRSTSRASTRQSRARAKNVAQFIADGQGWSVLSTLGAASVVVARRRQGRVHPPAPPAVKMLPRATADAVSSA